MKTALFIIIQYIVPQKLLSKLAGALAECKASWIKDRLIRGFIKRYNVDMSIAADANPSSYKHFNDFFTRPLAEGQRPITQDANSIACPADGCISQLGKINHGRIFQAKGQEYSLLELVGGDKKWSEAFKEGHFATVYLSPKDYHRVHIPLTGTLQSMVHIPGDLFSVNESTAEHVPRLFSRNERVACFFSTEAGPMAVILVGAMIVASIETPWAGLVTPIKKQIRTWNYGSSDAPHTFEKGDEIGRFKLGSTAIVLLGKDVASWEAELSAQSPVRMGEKIGSLN
ncbi:MAG: archaetidylserine decarboxylase [Cellvibrionaceae bacterium]